MPEFVEDQRVRVREEGGAPSSQPDKCLLGKEGTIFAAAQREIGSGRPISYWVEFDNGVVEAISPDWLEPR